MKALTLADATEKFLMYTTSTRTLLMKMDVQPDSKFDIDIVKHCYGRRMSSMECADVIKLSLGLKKEEVAA